MLDRIVGFLILWSVVCGIAIIVCAVARAMASDDLFGWETRYKQKWFKPFKMLIAAFVTLTTLAIFIPSTKQAAVVYLLPKIVNNEQVQKIPDNFAKLLNAKMEQWIRDTFEEKKDKKESP